MVPGDYIEKQIKNVNCKVVKSKTGVEYAIGSKIGKGGVGIVYRARRLSDGKKCVFKEYPYESKKRKVHSIIRKNIAELEKSPISDAKGNRLESFIGPMDKDSFISLPASRGFGYIMELVDMDRFINLMKMRHTGVYPDAETLCKICYNIANLFERVHLRGYCYKDISKDNIYMDPKTGEVRIIDCDNISEKGKKSILGTPDFLAPEVYITETPDVISDYYSMAALFFWILVGTNPMHGKKVEEYCKKNNESVINKATQKKLYGTEALFIFDPKDQSNTIRDYVDPQKPNMYKYQTEDWDRLPKEIKKAFIKTFSDGLKNENRHLRTTDGKWKDVFAKVQTESLVICNNSKCIKMNFGSEHEKINCLYCGKMLPQLAPIKEQEPDPIRKTGKQPIKKTGTQPIKKTGTQPIKKTGTQPIKQTVAQQKELTAVIFSVNRDIPPTGLKVQVQRKEGGAKVSGNKYYPGLEKGWMIIEYNRVKNLLSAKNMSQYTWKVEQNGNSFTCESGKRVILSKNLVITVIPGKLQFTVLDIV